MKKKQCLQITLLVAILLMMSGCQGKEETSQSNAPEVDTYKEQLNTLETNLSAQSINLQEKERQLAEVSGELDKIRAEFQSVEQENAILKEANRELEYYKSQGNFDEIKAGYLKWLEMQEYITNYVKVYDIELKDQDLTTSSNAGIKFKIRNNGLRAINHIEVVIYYLDEAGKPIYENTYMPLEDLATTTENQNRILKPGYIWESKKPYLIMDTLVPSEWAGKVDIRVKNIVFNGI